MLLMPNQERRIRERFAALSSIDREACWMLVNGHSNTDIATRLRISPTALQVHRHYILKRMAAQSVLDLSRMFRYLPTHAE